MLRSAAKSGHSAPWFMHSSRHNKHTSHRQTEPKSPRYQLPRMSTNMFAALTSMCYVHKPRIPVACRHKGARATCPCASHLLPRSRAHGCIPAQTPCAWPRAQWPGEKAAGTLPRSHCICDSHATHGRASRQRAGLLTATLLCRCRSKLVVPGTSWLPAFAPPLASPTDLGIRMARNVPGANLMTRALSCTFNFNSHADACTSERLFVSE